jgi:phage gp36-like protein
MKNIHLLPTEKPSRLFISSKDGELKLINHTKDFVGIKQNIFITSDEEIKVGNYRYSAVQNNIELVTEFSLKINNEYWKLNPHLYKKIILTTDPKLIADGVQAIDNEFLEWFIKNPSCERVEVKNYKFSEYPLDYKIVIPKEEPKQEIWKDIPNYESLYQVSNFGNVKSLERYVKGKVGNRLQKENILSKVLVGDKGNQYYAVTLCNNKDRKQIKVSVLVAMAFLNHIPNGYVGLTVDHIDNNPLNNNVDNLQVITKRKNSSKDRKGISKYTGVTFNKKSNKWRSQIWIDGRNKTLGSFDDELEAHRAYQKELQKHLKC